MLSCSWYNISNCIVINFSDIILAIHWYLVYTVVKRLKMNITLQVDGTKETLVENIRKAIIELQKQLPGLQLQHIKVSLSEVKK